MAHSIGRPGSGAALATADAELDGRIVATGVWLFLAADVFFFAAWWFSFFYLRALNNNNSWTPQGVGPPSRGFGLVVLLLVVLMAAAYWVTSRAIYGTTWFSLLTPASLILGIAACIFQGFAMWHLGFGLTQGGYASVFAGLTGAWLIQLVGAVAWLATVVVQGRPAGDTVLRPASAAAFGWILVFFAAVGVINFILLYLVH